MQIEKLKPRRIQFKFWLDANRDDERPIGEYLWQLRKDRKFSRTIRDAVSLLKSLREGRVDLLLKMFPNIEQEIAVHRMRAAMHRKSTNGYHPSQGQ